MCVIASPTCCVSFQYSIYSNMNETDARPAHIAQQKLGHCTIAHIEGYHCVGRLSNNVFGFSFIGLPIFTAWQSAQNRCCHLARQRPQTGRPPALLQRWRQASPPPPSLPLPPSPSPTTTIIPAIGTGLSHG